jgi:uncharacterized protein (TIGR00369 family)
MNERTLHDHLWPSLDNDCYGCSPDNPHGLRLHVVESEEGGVEAEWKPRRHFEGWPGVLHGGVLSTLVDELTGYAVTLAFRERDGADDRPIVTAEYTVRFLAMPRSDRSIRGRGWVSDLGERHAIAEASLASDGEQVVHCVGRYVRLRESPA